MVNPPITTIASDWEMSEPSEKPNPKGNKAQTVAMAVIKIGRHIGDIQADYTADNRKWKREKDT